MRTFLAKVVFVLLVGSIASAPAATAHSAATSIAQVKIEELVKQADLVAILRILSGDTESYPTTVYKAEVVQAFKGTQPRATIYFGPFEGYGVGKEFFVFLQNAEKGIEPRPQKGGAGLNYGTISSFYQVMYAGYSALSVEYECFFDGEEPAQKCEDGVKINTQQVILPKSVRTFSSTTKGLSGDEIRWVRKSVLVAYLEKLTVAPGKPVKYLR